MTTGLLMRKSFLCGLHNYTFDTGLYFFSLVQSDMAYFAMNLKSLHGMKDVEDSLGDVWQRANELRTTKTYAIKEKSLPNR